LFRLIFIDLQNVGVISAAPCILRPFFPFIPFYKSLLLSLIPSCIFTVTGFVSRSSQIYLNPSLRQVSECVDMSFRVQILDAYGFSGPLSSQGF